MQLSGSSKAVTLNRDTILRIHRCSPQRSTPKSCHARAPQRQDKAARGIDQSLRPMSGFLTLEGGKLRFSDAACCFSAPRCASISSRSVAVSLQASSGCRNANSASVARFQLCSGGLSTCIWQPTGQSFTESSRQRIIWKYRDSALEWAFRWWQANNATSD